MDNRDIKRYLREVRSWLPCSNKLKKGILDKILGNVSAFCEEHPEAGYDEIVARFGTPYQIASAYVDEMDTGELLKNLRIKRKVVRVVATVSAAIIATWLLVVGMVYFEGVNEVNGQVSVVGIEENISEEGSR